jgi:uncharacterized protein YebE (UPF0316 family)
MSLFDNLSPELVSWLIIPLLIFFARVADVTIGTIRIVFVARGQKSIAPLLGFVEVLIWIVAMSQIMKYANNWPSFLAWAGGFAVGNYIGLWIEEKLAIGNLVIRIITAKPANALVQHLREAGYGVTSLDAQGSVGEVALIFTLVKRRDVKAVIAIVKNHNPKAFYTIEDVRFTSDMVFGPTKSSKRSLFGNLSTRLAK